MAGLHGPLPTLRPWPRGQTRTARGRRGSLLLRRIGLSPTTPGRSPGALPSPVDQNPSQADLTFLGVEPPSPLQCDRFQSTGSGITSRYDSARKYARAIYRDPMNVRSGSAAFGDCRADHRIELRIRFGQPAPMPPLSDHR